MTAVATALAVRGLGKDWGARTAVGAIDLDIRAGECFGLLGPNGAGKTTTIAAIAGVTTPSRGTIEILGHDLVREPYAAKAKLGLVPQDLALYEELSAEQNLRYFGALYGLSRARLASRIDAVLTRVGLAGRRRDQVKQFSGGMKRRLNIAIALVHEPALLLLDEPTVGVDPQSRAQIFELIRELRAGGTTIVITSHYIEEVEALCDRVAIVDHGAVVALGTVHELVSAHAGSDVVVELAGDDAAIAAAADAAAPHARVVREGRVLRLLPAGGLAPVIEAIERSGARIERITSRTANLETAFLALTGRALRDEP